jgi:hypothetical protein
MTKPDDQTARTAEQRLDEDLLARVGPHRLRRLLNDIYNGPKSWPDDWHERPMGRA